VQEVLCLGWFTSDHVLSPIHWGHQFLCGITPGGLSHRPIKSLTLSYSSMINWLLSIISRMSSHKNSACSFADCEVPSPLQRPFFLCSTGYYRTSPLHQCFGSVAIGVLPDVALFSCLQSLLSVSFLSLDSSSRVSSGV